MTESLRRPVEIVVESVQLYDDGDIHGVLALQLLAVKKLGFVPSSPK